MNTKQSQIRFDAGSLRKPERDPKTGWLRIDANISKVGVLPYVRPDGKVFREYRPADEVFHPDSLASLTNLPVTLQHPPGLLNAENTRQFQVGTLHTPRRGESGHVAASLLVTDADTIKAIEGGLRQVSLGYTADVAQTPGEFNGERYDGTQQNIRGNHLALVQEARGGPSLSLRMDSAASVDVPVTPTWSDVRNIAATPSLEAVGRLSMIATNRAIPSGIREEAAKTVLGWFTPGSRIEDWRALSEAVDRLGRDARDLQVIKKCLPNRNGSLPL